VTQQRPSSAPRPRTRSVSARKPGGWSRRRRRRPADCAQSLLRSIDECSEHARRYGACDSRRSSLMSLPPLSCCCSWCRCVYRSARRATLRRALPIRASSSSSSSSSGTALVATRSCWLGGGSERLLAPGPVPPQVSWYSRTYYMLRVPVRDTSRTSSTVGGTCTCTGLHLSIIRVGRCIYMTRGGRGLLVDKTVNLLLLVAVSDGRCATSLLRRPTDEADA
jgi:hypothetical protein